MIAGPSSKNAEPRPLPRLRADLAIAVVADAGSGYPAVVVTDPVRGSYFRLTWPASVVALHWREAPSSNELCELLRRTYGLEAAAADIEGVAEFALANQLTEADAAGGWQSYVKIRAAGKHGLFKGLMHNYLFFRIPLVRPDKWLQTLLAPLAFLYSRTFWIALTVLAMVGLYLTARQWSAVEVALQDALRLEGMLVYAVAILGLKAIHELGHALTAARQGCHVPSMGVAFMLGAPVLYTDVSDSWRLARRRARLSIVFAGVLAELIVAVAAILLWSFLPDGMLRQVCFALATTSILLSLFVNLNPFMRFDGYFALSDILNVPNLQPRAFALATWRMRETLFGLGHAPPEVFPRGLHRTLIIYAYFTWVYRLTLYLGIAAVVYVMAGKALGIVLGLFEIMVFIAKPFYQELAAWWKMRAAIVKPRRTRWTAAATTCGLLALVVPWLGTVEVPSVLIASNEEAVHLPFAARLTAIEVREGQRVEAGQVLFRADTSDLDRLYAKFVIERRALEIQRDRLHANDKEQETRLIILSKLAKARERLAALDRQREQLIIKAPFSGTIVDLDDEISTGLWLNTKQPLARLIADGKPQVRGVVSETEVSRLQTNAAAVFVGDNPTDARRNLRLISIAPISDGQLSEPILSDRHGGFVPTVEERGELRTRTAWFQVRLESDGTPPQGLIRGVARVEGSAVSPGTLLWRQVMRVLVREQSF